MQRDLLSFSTFARVPYIKIKKMKIIVDGQIPKQALEKLSEYGNLVLFSTKNITYDAISGHPDIFFCNMGEQWIYGSNLPDVYTKRLKKFHGSIRAGETPVGSKYPESARYNAVVTDNYIIHNFRYTDPVITHHAGERELIHVSQGYTRCNLLPLKNDHFITSDEGIYRTLTGYGLNVLLVGSKDILLPGIDHGFFGGACGIYEDTVFVIGNLSHFSDGKRVHDFLHKNGFQIVELYDGPLFDGGSILIH